MRREPDESPRADDLPRARHGDVVLADVDAVCVERCGERRVVVDDEQGAGRAAAVAHDDELVGQRIR